jgi:hypothetical protein
MRLRVIIVLADHENDRIPKIPIQVSLDSVPNNLGLANVDRFFTGLGVRPREKVHAGVFCFDSRQNALEIRAWSRHRFSRPVGDFGSPKSLRVTVREEQFDGG